jgi:hypothetical protein
MPHLTDPAAHTTDDLSNATQTYPNYVLTVQVEGRAYNVVGTRVEGHTLVLLTERSGAADQLRLAGWTRLSPRHPDATDGESLWSHPQVPTAAAPTWWALENIATPEACDPRAQRQPGWYPGQWQRASTLDLDDSETFEDPETLWEFAEDYEGAMRAVGVIPEQLRCVTGVRDVHGGWALLLAADDESGETLMVVRNTRL